MTRFAVTSRPDSAETHCRNCHHPIRHFDSIGWIDMTPAVRGGLYDFCTAPHGTHMPDS